MGVPKKPGLVGRSCERGSQRVQGLSLLLLRGPSKTWSSVRGTYAETVASLGYEASLGRGGHAPAPTVALGSISKTAVGSTPPPTAGAAPHGN